MSKGKKPAGAPKQVEALRHAQAKRKNIPTAELQSAAQRAEEIAPFAPVTYPRRHPLAQGEARPRDKDLDPQMVWKGARVRLTADQIKKAAETGFVDISDAQLVWRGKDQQDWSDLVVHAPPLYIQEKIHPKAIIDDLTRQTKAKREADTDAPDLFHDFNGIDPEAKTEFYVHDQNWSNRFILGDSLQVMASLAEREGLRGQVQCIYFDPPYGIKFNSNWQVSTRSRDVKDGKIEEISREPEQVRAFRDTWKDGIHSYLTYLRDRMTAMRDLLTESGSIFVQIGDENVHRVRSVLDEVFGEENIVSTISFSKSSSTNSPSGKTLVVPSTTDFILWYAKNAESVKYRPLYKTKQDGSSFEQVYRTDAEGNQFTLSDLTAQKPTTVYTLNFRGRGYSPLPRGWRTTADGAERLIKADRIEPVKSSVRYRQLLSDYPIIPQNNFWADTGTGSFTEDKVYVVQSGVKVVQRCILMASDPGDLVLDPTCGSGTAATVAEQWGRRWITIDTSRVALALARARVMGAKYPYYQLSDSKEGRLKEAELAGKLPIDASTHGDIRQGFVYERAPHITLKSIANNSEIDVIWEEFQSKLEPLRLDLCAAVGKEWKDWEIPRDAMSDWSDNIKGVHRAWWELRDARQKKIDASISKRADVELLYDRPFEDKNRVRVAGPFTVESLSPHRVVPASEIEQIEQLDAAAGKRKRTLPKGTDELNDFTTMILEHLKSSGVQQAKKDDRIEFTAINGWPGDYIAGDGRFMEGETEKRVAVFIGPEFGTVSRADLTAAAREALDARFDALIACGFNFEAHTSELNKLGPLPILKAKMNPELHMSDELKNTGAGNLFVVFGEPDIKWEFDSDGEIVVEVLGVDVFDPKTGDVRASGKDDIAAWFIDTDYDETSFFVRHAYFMGANDPYKSLKTALKAEIDEDAWASLYRDTSRPFARPETGRFAVKVINHFGDEVMKVFAV
ncbi:MULTISPECIES: site-specific DNA-methyltransferase [Mesorhizobium]|uniref:site-specific DNA-methyltransferase n=1 Tax=Mesorhizobium TaxID=68287 RepID=UPI0007FF8D07|nr:MULTISPECIES: site-specific DNA-methyltransferase [Mesorhizobium]MUT27055.1 site-specific DNA-methyltransferase [Mesorhizobium japonicum]OBQ74038.1 DNA methylase [Mesorhizobium sp. WSM3873]